MTKRILHINTTRIIALVLIISILFGLLPQQVFADVLPQTPEIEDLKTLLTEKGELQWSELTDGERDFLLSLYDISSYIFERLDEAGVALERSLSCILVLASTSLSLEDVLVANDSYEYLWDVITLLNELEQIVLEIDLTDEQYLALRVAIIQGEALEELLEEFDLGAPMLMMSAGDPPSPPQVELSYVAPYSVGIGENESVSLNTGALTLQYPLVSMPGISGMDVDLGIQYNSSDANLFGMDVGYNDIMQTYYCFNYKWQAWKDIAFSNGNPGSHQRVPEYDVSEKYAYTSKSIADSDYRTYIYSPNQSLYLYSEPINVQQKYVSNIVGFIRKRVATTNANGVYISDVWTPDQSTTPVPSSYYYYNVNGDGYEGYINYTGDANKTRDIYYIKDGIKYDEYHKPSSPYTIYETWYCYYSGIVQRYDVRSTHYYLVPAPDSNGVYSESILVDRQYYSTTKSPTYGQKTGDIGAGWSWNIPSYDSTNRVLHLGNGSALALNSGNYGFKDHTLQDMVFSAALTSDFNNNNSLSSSFKLSYSDGTTEWFNSDGRCIGRSDRFGNKIYYQYTTGTYGYRLSKVIDTSGREINITYATSSVTITAPDGKQTVLALGKYSNGPNVLQGITAPGHPPITFEYDFPNASFYINNCGSANNKVANLWRINHPTGGKTEYTYTAVTEGIGSGYNTVYKLNSRKDIIGSTSYATTSYLYSGTYTGYPSYYKQSDLPSNYTYTTTVATDGVSTVCTFNNNGLQISSNTKKGALQLQTQAIDYGSNKLPVKVTTRNYEASGVNYMETIEMAEYDSKGHVLFSWSAMANGMKGVQTDDYKTSYTYDATYGLLLTHTSKRDANNTVSLTNTLSLDKKTILYTEVRENNVLKQKTGYTYDAKGQLLTASSYKDNFIDTVQTSYVYDIRGNITSISTDGVKNSDNTTVTSLGFTTGTVGTCYAYDIMGRISTTTDARGEVVSYAYDAAGNIQTVTYPGNAQIQYARNYADNMLTVTDLLGTVVRYEYDAFGHELFVRDMETGLPLSTKTYDNMFRLMTETGPAGSVTISYTSYDPRGRVLEVIAQDSSGTLAQEGYSYDDAALLNGVRYVKTTKTVHGGITAPSNVTTEYRDKTDNVVKQGYFLNNTEYFDTFEYDYIGNKIKALSALDADKSLPFTAQWEYDYAGRVTKETNALNQSVFRTYDALGRNVTATDYAGSASTFEYDVLGRLLRQQTPFEQTGGTTYYAVKTYDYDQTGNVIREQTQNNAPGATVSWAKTEYTYNSRGFLTDADSYDGVTLAHKACYTYDAAGNMLTQTTGAQGNAPATTAYTYDRFGKVLTITDPLNQIEIYTYDLAGNVLTKLDRNGALTEYQYDGLDRPLETLVTKNNAAIGYTALTYTLTGQTATLSNGSYTTTNTYDALGRLTQVEETGSVVKTYAYDLGGSRTSFTLTRDSITEISTTYTYDALSRLETVKENNVLLATYTYDTNGNRASLAYANGITTTYAYNLVNLVTSLQNKLNSTVKSSYTYTYYLDGNQRTKTDHTGRTTTYTYDGLARLTCEVESGAPDALTYEYTYDARSNRSHLTVTGAESYTVDYSYDLNNRLLETVKTIGAVDEITTYQYDPNGNTISRLTEAFAPAGNDSATLSFLSLGGGGWELNFYNGFNQLVSTTIDGLETVYTYNPTGLRHSKTTGGITTTHIWDGSNIAVDLVGQAEIIYIRGINLISADDGSGSKYYLYNAHGDVVQLADSLGAVIQSYDYDAFGVEREPSDSDSNPWRYCGEYWDSETGTVYLRARYYDPVVGRFTQEDTHWNPGNSIYGDNPHKINMREPDERDSLGLNTYTLVPDINAIMQSNNLYVYCMNNPIYFYDPTGDLSDAAIHNMVAAVIATIYFPGTMLVNTRIDYSDGRYGFADLVNIQTGEVWEIKKDTLPLRGKNGALVQLERYVNGRLHLRGYQDLKLNFGGSMGTRIKRGEFYVPDTFWTYHVTYWDLGNGIIQYHVDKTFRWESLAAIVTGVIFIVTFICGMPVYIPSEAFA